MKKLAIVLCFFTSLWSLQAQNPQWSFPNKFWNQQSFFNLSSPGGGNNYAGQTTTENHNIIVNSNGSLAYFIVGSKIYDPRGIFID